MSYNHMFTIAFAVSGSLHSKGADVTPQMLKTALLKRIHDLDQSPNKQEWIEATGAPDDTYEEEENTRRLLMTTPTYAGLINRLRDIRICEDFPLMDAAADTLETQGQELAEYKAREDKAECVRCGCSMGRVGERDWAQENADLRARLMEAAAALEEAACDVGDWGGYASEYFQDKHDLTGYVQRIKDAANTARAAGGEDGP